ITTASSSRLRKLWPIALHDASLGGRALNMLARPRISAPLAGASAMSWLVCGACAEAEEVRQAASAPGPAETDRRQAGVQACPHHHMLAESDRTTRSGERVGSGTAGEPLRTTTPEPFIDCE